MGIIEFWKNSLTKKGKVAVVFIALILIAIILILASGGINAPAGMGNG